MPSAVGALDSHLEFVMPFEPGQTLAEKYEVVSLIGAGSASFAVAAVLRSGAEPPALTTHELDDPPALARGTARFDSSLARGTARFDVTLKFLRPELAARTRAVERFLLAAGNQRKLHSEHIVRVLDVDRLPDGRPFVVMGRPLGADLRAVLHDRGRLPVPVAVDFALQVCEALATAHAAKIIHGDLRPENVLLTRPDAHTECLKLLDFGLCQEALTREEPELDARSDILSLGCMLDEMLLGPALYQSELARRTARVDQEGHEASVGEPTPQLPAELRALVARCRAEDPAERPQTIAELAGALTPFAPAHAYANAERCAQLLESAQRVSGVQSVGRESRHATRPVLVTPAAASPRSRAEAPTSPGELGLPSTEGSPIWSSVMGPLGLVLCVPVISTLGWLYASRPLAPVGAERTGAQAIVGSHAEPRPSMVGSRAETLSSRAEPRPPTQRAHAVTQQEVGPVVVLPLQPAPNLRSTALQAGTTPSKRARVWLPKAARNAPLAARTKPSTAPLRGTAEGVAPSKLGVVPKPDPYDDSTEHDLAEPDVGF